MNQNAETSYQLPQRDPEKIKSMFNAISFRYDLLNFLMSFGLDSFWRKRVINEAKLQENDKVLDLACGTGDIAFDFEKYGPTSIQIKATDFSSEMINNAKIKANSKKNSRVLFSVGDALHIDEKDQSMDVITIGFALRNLASLPKAFEEMLRVLKPGGRLLCLDLTRPSSMVLKLGHSVFLRTYIPLVGTLFSGDFKAYSYLAQSIREFPPSPVIISTMAEAGFSNCRAIPLAGGISTIFMGYKE